MTSETQPVRFGLIGFGAWGRHHADAIAKTDGAELAAVACRGDASAAEARRLYPSAFVTTDYRQLLARDDVEVVDVVVPSSQHHRLTTDALAAGKDVLLEKPMGVTVGQCDDLIGKAKAAGRTLAIGHELRLSSLWGKVKAMVDAGAIGTPRYALVELSRNPYRLGSGGWRYDAAQVGNWILEEPIHFFDLARWYLSAAGEPTTVYARGNSRDAARPDLHDNFSAIVSFAGGAYAVVSQTLAAFEHHQTVKLTGTEGAIWASWSGAMDRTRHPTFSLRAMRAGADVETIPIAKMTGELFELEDQIAMLVAAVRGRGTVACTAEDGRWSVLMCLAAAESVATGGPVEIARFAAGPAR